MPDIAMCKGDDEETGTTCPRAGDCYRCTANPSHGRQTWFMTPPIKDDGTCDYYWPNRSDE